MSAQALTAEQSAKLQQLSDLGMSPEVINAKKAEFLAANAAQQATAPLTVSDMLVMDMTTVRNQSGLYGNLDAFVNSTVTLGNIECVIGKTTKKPHFRTTKQTSASGKRTESKVYLSIPVAYYCAAKAGLLVDETDGLITPEKFAAAFNAGEQLQMKIQSMGYAAQVRVALQGDRAAVVIE